MKKNIFFNFLIVLFFFVASNDLKAQIKCKIENYSTEDGLSHDAIRDILKGKDGFMWFATWDGLNRYDGKNFITYKATAGDNSSLGNNRIDLLKEDTAGHIWFKAYDNQIYRFEKSTEKFLSISRILGTTKIEFREIFPDRNGNIWLMTKNKGVYFVPKNIDKKGKIIHFEKNYKKELSLTSNTLNFLFEDKDNTIWVGSDQGLDRIATTKDQQYKSSPIVKNSNIKSYFTQATNSWFGTKEGTLICYNSIRKNYWKTSLSTKSINAIISSKNKNFLYITTSAGELITFNTRTLKTVATLKIADDLFTKYIKTNRDCCG